uniref:CID domain-containing protein n=1 Tax=Sinocyclocheilus grahami TaxID=75366 RepID=A0A672N4J0_SINGR
MAAALDSSMERRFQGVSNTMESIQGLSSWCIENKKHHSLVVRCWMKWLKKCELLTIKAFHAGSSVFDCH